MDSGEREIWGYVFLQIVLSLKNNQTFRHFFECWYANTFLSDSTTYAPKDKTAESTQAPGGNFLTGRNVMIFTGSFISLILMVAILRETYTYFRIISLTPPVDTSTADDIYEEVAV